MSIHILGDVRVGDLSRFLEVFGSEGLAKRREHSCLSSEVYAADGDQGESGRVVVLLEFPDEASFDGFRTDPTAPPIMRKGGAQGPPSFARMTRAASFPG